MTKIVICDIIIPMILSLKSKEAKLYTKEEIYNILREYINEQKDLSLRKMIDDESFSRPSWSEHQAHQLGIQKGLNKILSFLPDRENIN